ncbi:MAG TPA: hypothetical protein VMV74_01475 [Bacteroidales bacterium]|nr:hypothetical protein [Bacteroidales bacterium]
MKRWILCLPLLLLLACNREEGLVWFSSQKAGDYFRKVETLCNSDSGRLWGENLFGPVMFVDSRTRTIYANVADRENLLKSKDGIFTGVLPRERLITNNVIEFGGVRYAMAPLPDEEDSVRITSRAIHSLFHCFQERHDLKPSTFNTRHMNQQNARLFLKLEWKALTNAIKSTGDARNQAIRDALIFRGARRELFPDAITDENKFENYEGLTTFTYMKLGSSGDDELKTRLLDYLERIYSNSSYASGYGFVHGALYGYLLDCKGFDFKQIETPDFDLGQATAIAYNVTLPALCRDVAGSLALNYDLPAIRAEEVERVKKIAEQTHKIVTTFTEKPVLIVQMESPNFSFEPEDINSLDTLGILYMKLRVSDNWGKLTVNDGGALLTNDLRTLRVSAREVQTERNHVTGTGWHLVMNDGWQAEKDGDNFIIRKQLP